jgi:hypothetical protein
MSQEAFPPPIRINKAFDMRARKRPLKEKIPLRREASSSISSRAIKRAALQERLRLGI